MDLKSTLTCSVYIICAMTVGGVVFTWFCPRPFFEAWYAKRVLSIARRMLAVPTTRDMFASEESDIFVVVYFLCGWVGVRIKRLSCFFIDCYVITLKNVLLLQRTNKRRVTLCEHCKAFLSSYI